jgi:hypothetical protein
MATNRTDFFSTLLGPLNWPPAGYTFSVLPLWRFLLAERQSLV